MGKTTLIRNKITKDQTTSISKTEVRSGIMVIKRSTRCFRPIRQNRPLKMQHLLDMSF